MATIVEGDLKTPFSIATPLRCRGGCYSFPWIASTLPLIRTLKCWVLSKEVSSTIFKVFSMTRPGIEPRSPRPLTNTLPTRLMRILDKRLELQVTILNTNNLVIWHQVFITNLKFFFNKYIWSIEKTLTGAPALNRRELQWRGSLHSLKLKIL